MSNRRIVRTASILSGKPCVEGTRISVETVLRRLSIGLSPEQVAAEYPELTVNDVLAALSYAAEYMRHDGLVVAAE